MIEQYCKTLIPGYDPWATAGDAWFDGQAAADACEFFPQYLRHIEGSLAGQPFALEPWQTAIVGNLFGWLRKDNAGRTVRRYRESLVYVPRKNGKTPLCAGIGLRCVFLDPERGQQNYIAASTREQAGLLFRHCRGMVEQETALSSRCRIYGGNAPGGQSQSIVREQLGSFLKIISGDVTVGKHGKNLNLAIVDELHEQPGRDLVDTLRTSMASANKPQPLMLYATTADYDKPSICNEIYEYAAKVRDGVIDDQRFLPVIYEAKTTDDWTSPAVWAAANPNLGISVSAEYLASECARAQEQTSLQNLFQRLHLNIRTGQDVRWLSLEQWDATDTPVPEDMLTGKACWCGLDMSTTTDLSALAMVFREPPGYVVKTQFWVPAEKARQREQRDRVPYQQWINDGWITATPGATIDYDQVRQDINELGTVYDIREIAADRWNATQLIQQLDGDGYNIFAHGQGYVGMTAPAKEFERAVAAGEITFCGNPVMRWMGSNVAVEQDAAGNLKPSKKKSTDRIDGIVAAVMGVGRASMGDETASVYDTRGLLTLDL